MCGCLRVVVTDVKVVEIRKMKTYIRVEKQFPRSVKKKSITVSGSTMIEPHPFEQEFRNFSCTHLSLSTCNVEVIVPSGPSDHRRISYTS